MESLHKALDKMPNMIMRQLKNVQTEDLNTVTMSDRELAAYHRNLNNDEEKTRQKILANIDGKIKTVPEEHISAYDPTESFRLELLEQGFKITALFQCYYSGWECDQWAAEGEKDGKKYKITTNHGGYEFKEL